MVEVPDLTDMDRGQVHEALAAVGLEMREVVTKNSDTIPEGIFIKSDPKPGTSVETGSTVKVTFSKGAGEVQVPDLSGKTTGEANTILKGVGLVLGDSTTVDDYPVEKDRVVSSSPAAGEKVASGATININISSGMVTIPEVVGMTQTEATSALIGAGLTVAQTSLQELSNDPEGTVIGTSPQQPGARIALGSTVTLIVSTGAGPTTAPTETPTEQPTTTPTGSNNGGTGSGGGTGGGSGNENPGTTNP